MTNDVPDHPAEPAILDFLKYLVDDDDAADAREHFCEVVNEEIANIASWLAVDAWLGAGDVRDTNLERQSEPDPTRRRSFVAVGLVAQISSELVSGALLLFRNGNQYAASALVRQLIECEYLFRAFRLNFADAARWHDANDADRWDFKPSKLREIGGFDRKEYGNHCEAGGHPHPKGRLMLELPRTMRELERTAAGETDDLNMIRVLRLDFAFHCDRIWRALCDVLVSEHARFERVRAESLAAASEAFAAWDDADPMARHGGLILGAVDDDPTRPLSELINFTDEPPAED